MPDGSRNVKIKALMCLFEEDGLSFVSVSVKKLFFFSENMKLPCYVITSKLKIKKIEITDRHQNY